MSFDIMMREMYYIIYGIFILVMVVKYIKEVPNKKNFLPFAVATGAFIVYCFAVSVPRLSEMFFLFLGNFILLFLCLNFKINLKTLVYFFIAGVLTGVTIGLIMGYAPYGSYGLVRFSALTGNPNRLYFYVVAGINALFVLEHKKQISWKEFVPLFSILFAIGLTSISRNFILVFAANIIIYGVLKVLYEKKQFWKPVLIVGLCMAAACSIMFKYTEANLMRMNVIEGYEASVEPTKTSPDGTPLWGGTHYDPGRSRIWELNLKDWASSPWKILFGRGVDTSLHFDGYPLLHEHNVYIFILVRTGIVGVILFIALWVTFFYTLFRIKKFSLFPLILIAVVMGLGLFELRFPHLYSFLFFMFFVFSLDTKTEKTKEKK